MTLDDGVGIPRCRVRRGKCKVVDDEAQFVRQIEEVEAHAVGILGWGSEIWGAAQALVEFVLVTDGEEIPNRDGISRAGFAFA